MIRAMSLAHRCSSLWSATRAFATLPEFDYVPKPYTGPSAEEVLAMRKQHLSPCMWCCKSSQQVSGWMSCSTLTSQFPVLIHSLHLHIPLQPYHFISNAQS